MTRNFYANGHLIERLQELLSVWTQSIEASSTIKANHALILAPAAFMGLGLIGILFTFEAPPIESPKS